MSNPSPACGRQMYSSFGALGSSAHLMRSMPSVMSLIVPQYEIRMCPSSPNSQPGTTATRTFSSNRSESWSEFRL